MISRAYLLEAGSGGNRKQDRIACRMAGSGLSLFGIVRADLQDVRGITRFAG